MADNLQNNDQNSGNDGAISPKDAEPGFFDILIIDDDKWIQRVLINYLRNWKLSAMPMQDPIEGMVFAIEKKPKLILLDIKMPYINGDSVLRFLKNLKITAKIPVIIISGNLEKDLVRDLYQKGADGFLSKPVTIESLYEKLKSVLGAEAFAEFEEAEVKKEHEPKQ